MADSKTNLLLIAATLFALAAIVVGEPSCVYGWTQSPPLLWRNALNQKADWYAEYGTGRMMAYAPEDVSVAFHPGKLTLLMGTPGSGKTTSPSVPGCLVSPNRVSVRVLGNDITGWPESAKTELRRPKIGYVFQAFRLFRALTAMENILLAMELSGRTGRQAHEAAMEVAKCPR